MDVVELAYVLRLDEVDVRERGESKKMRELEGEGTGSGSAAPHRKGRELLTSYATSRTRCTDMLAGLKSSSKSGQPSLLTPSSRDAIDN